MRPEEEFVGDRLVGYFGGSTKVSVLEGEDPPDLYLKFSNYQIGVEVTRLSQFTFEPDGALGNRTTQDSFGVNLINKLDADLGSLLPDDLSLLIGMETPVQNPARFKREVRKWIVEVVSAPVLNVKERREIEGSDMSAVIIPQRPSGKKIVGFVSNKNSSADIDLNVRLVLADRIRTKSKTCASLKKPIWLALLNDYWIADAASYVDAAKQLNQDHCFERVFLVSERDAVCELDVGTQS